MSGKDLTDFFAWYEQAGTPKVTLKSTYHADRGELTLELAQETAPTPGQPVKGALPIPVTIGLLDQDGRTQAFVRDGQATDETVIVLDGAKTKVTLTGVDERPVVSALRGFSAPVKLTSNAEAKDRYVLLAGDPDLFNRWEAGQELARALILGRATGMPDEVGEERYAEAVGRALADQAADPAFKALLLMLPSEPDLALAMAPADPAEIHQAREALRLRLSLHLADELKRLHSGLQAAGEFSPTPPARAGVRFATPPWT